MLLDVRYIGNKGTRLPRMIEANPAVYGPGATSDNADQRRLYAGCHGAGGTCDFAFGRAHHEFHEFDISRGASRSFAALRQRPGVPRLLHVFEDARLCFDFQRRGLGARGWWRAKTISRRIRSI